ncbi:M61 family metallopeptidase, partial [candidate division KSB1 bacterium]|nr:M61 family metallopeptidase [candidate division KSB1 bacterium]
MKILQLFLGIILLFSQIFAQDIHYTITANQGNSHILSIEMKASASQNEFIDFRIPSWRPGRYVMQNFARNVIKFEAFNESNTALEFKKTDKDTWRVQTGSSQSVTARYDYYANEFDAGNTYLNDREIYLNPITCLMYIPGRELEPVDLFIENKMQWPVASALDYDAHTGIFSAPDYHELADNPIVISNDLSRIEFSVGSHPLEIILLGDYWYDSQKIVTDFKHIVEQSSAIFNDIPFKKYVFFFHLVNYRSGHGVEHKNSTSIVTGPTDFHDTKFYREFLGVTTHEFFHLWNVERIRPAALWHPDYATENYSETIWFFEGVTSYYTPLILRQAELLTPDKFLKETASAINQYNKNYGRKVTSAAQSSFESWTHAFGNTPPNSQLTFYLNGKMIGLGLDLEIRHRTENKKSLDDVMRYLWDNYGKKEIGMPEQAIQEAVEKISASSFDDFFKDYVNGTKSLDFVHFLKYAGIEVQRDLKKDSSHVYTGLNLAGDKTQTTIRNVLPHSPAWDAGLDIGDILIAIDGRHVYKDNFSRYLQRFQPGDSLHFSVIRNEYLRVFTLVLQPPPTEMQTIKL